MKKEKLESLKSALDGDFVVQVKFGNAYEDVLSEDEIEVLMRIMVCLPESEYWGDGHVQYEPICLSDITTRFLNEEQVIIALESLLDKDIIYYDEEGKMLELWVPGLYQYIEKQRRNNQIKE